MSYSGLLVITENPLYDYLFLDLYAYQGQSVIQDTRVNGFIPSTSLNRRLIFGQLFWANKLNYLTEYLGMYEKINLKKVSAVCTIKELVFLLKLSKYFNWTLIIRINI